MGPDRMIAKVRHANQLMKEEHSTKEVTPVQVCNYIKDNKDTHKIREGGDQRKHFIESLKIKSSFR